MIKVDGKPEPYWMEFMRSWLASLQETLNKAVDAGIIPTNDPSKLAKEAVSKNFTLSEEFFLARQLLCSNGTRFECPQGVILNVSIF